MLGRKRKTSLKGLPLRMETMRKVGQGHMFVSVWSRKPKLRTRLKLALARRRSRKPKKAE